MAKSREVFKCVGDLYNCRMYLELIDTMLTSRLPTDEPMPTQGLGWFADPAKAIFEVYSKQGPDEIRDMLLWMPRAFDALNREFERQFKEEEAYEAASQFRVYSVDELLAQKPVRYLDADRTIQENGVTMVVGQPGAGKSLWALRKNDEIAQKYPVLMVAAEAQDGMSDRIRALEAANDRPLSRNLHSIQQQVILRDPQTVDAFILRAREYAPKLITFDTWAACTAGVDENSAADVTKVTEAVEKIRTSLECAILFVHHTRKDGTVYRGSSAIHGWVDNMFSLTLDEGRIRFKAVKTRHSTHPRPQMFQMVEYETRTDDETGEPVTAPALVPAGEMDASAADAGRARSHARTVLEALASFDQGVSALVLQDATGLSNGTVHRALKDLKRDGWVVQEQQGAPYEITPEGQQAVTGSLA